MKGYTAVDPKTGYRYLTQQIFNTPGQALAYADYFIKENGKQQSKKEVKNKGLQGSTQESQNMSFDPSDYDDYKQINSKNVVDIYNEIKDNSTIRNSTEHSKYLENFLRTIVQKVINPTILLLTTNTKEAYGAFKPLDSGKAGIIALSSQVSTKGAVSGAMTHSLRMSSGEVYAHELTHSVIYRAIRDSKVLYAKALKLFNLTEKKLGKDGYKAFLTDPEINVADPANKAEVKAAKERYNYIFRNTISTTTSYFSNGVDSATNIERFHEQSNFISEFITLGSTNENFRKSLLKLIATDTDIKKFSLSDLKGANIQEMFMNFIQLILDTLFSKIKSKQTKGASIGEELLNLTYEMSMFEQKEKSALRTQIDKIGSLNKKISKHGNKFMRELVLNRKVVKAGIGIKDMLGKVKETDTALGLKLRQIDYAYRNLNEGLTKSTIAEIRGNTARMGNLYDQLHVRNLTLDGAKQEVSDDYINSSNSKFSRILEQKEKEVITKTLLKTNASTLLDILNIKKLHYVFKSRNRINSEIDKVNQSLEKAGITKEVQVYFDRATDALGHFMITSEQRSDEAAFQPAVIAGMKNTEYADKMLSSLSDLDLIAHIERLATLKSLLYLSKKDRLSTAKLLKEEQDGIYHVLKLHKALQDWALEVSFNNNKMTFVHGYTKPIFNPYTNIAFGSTIKDAQELKNRGFVKLSKLLEKDPADMTNVETAMYVNTTANTKNQVSSIYSFTNEKPKGAGSNRRIEHTGITFAEQEANQKIMLMKKQADIDAMFNPVRKDYKGSFLVPKTDLNGIVTDYRYMMSEQIKTDVLDQTLEFDRILGGTASQILDRRMTYDINKDLMNYLHATYENEYKENPDGFVSLSPSSKDPKLRELFYMLTRDSREQGSDLWGTMNFKVPKDFLAISFGYKEYSVTNAFTKNASDRKLLEKLLVKVGELVFKENAPKKLQTIEHYIAEATKVTKNIIVVKTGLITLDNFGSNMMYLKSRGVPITYILKKGMEGLVYGNKYQADSKKLRQLEMDIASNKESYSKNKKALINTEIVKLKNAIFKNPVTKTVEAGLLTSLVDDIETTASGAIYLSPAQKKIKKVTDKLPNIIQGIGKQVFLSEDTTTYKILNNAVKMTDFVGRYVLYTHYEKKGISHKKAVKDCLQEFVDFAAPTHKIIDYGNKMGVFWFTRYGLRILNVIKNSAIDRPFDTLVACMISCFSGLDNIVNSIPGITKNFFSFANNPLTMFTEALDEPLPIHGIKSILN